MLRPTAIKVFPLDNYRLKILFDNNETKIFDVKPYIKGNWYSELSDLNYFQSVFTNGYTVEWANGQDICPDELYYDSIFYNEIENNFADTLKITEAKVTDHLMMLLTFSNGEKRVFDATVLTGSVFEPLADDNIFNDFKIVHGAITWMDEEINCAPE